MSGERDERDEPGEHGRSSDRDGRRDRDEPLGNLAAEVRERTGDRPAAERPDAPQREGPLADAASEVDERRRKRREAKDGGDAFESMAVGELDGERLWEQLAEGDEDFAVSVASEATDPAAESPVDNRDVVTIPKETCHGCPHFGDPPELACTHEGTSIVAMPDSDHFRVADCPIPVDGEEDVGVIGLASDESADGAE
jgi:hypothetical protein